MANTCFFVFKKQWGRRESWCTEKSREWERPTIRGTVREAVFVDYTRTRP